MPIPTEEELLKAACHIGHRKDKWNPKIAPYLFGERNGVHIFDLTQTREHLEKVCAALRDLQKRGKVVLIVSTKQQSTLYIEALGKAFHQPFVTRKWIPGLLTNWSTIKRRLQYYLDLKQSFQTGEVEKYTKKEQVKLRKELNKLEAAFSGIVGMQRPPDALLIVDAVHDHVAVLEARTLKIPIYGICDSNANPMEFTLCIPANDDAVKSIEMILKTIEREVLGEKGTDGTEDTQETKATKETDTSTSLSTGETKRTEGTGIHTSVPSVASVPSVPA